jgi:hypothetical protein
MAFKTEAVKTNLIFLQLTRIATLYFLKSSISKIFSSILSKFGVLDKVVSLNTVTVSWSEVEVLTNKILFYTILSLEQ